MTNERSADSGRRARRSATTERKRLARQEQAAKLEQVYKQGFEYGLEGHDVTEGQCLEGSREMVRAFYAGNAAGLRQYKAKNEGG